MLEEHSYEHPRYYNDRHYSDHRIEHEELEWPETRVHHESEFYEHQPTSQEFGEWNQHHNVDPWFEKEEVVPEHHVERHYEDSSDFDSDLEE